ncbi:MAG: ribosome maturation factor RimM [Deltaproteobacteria bacterium]|jgi:16S rRNA processing protein RimM|nr:ribosome maturation factor RimM [Deltaproteobacteria bacterium]MCL5880493.1 ribosome maturation factor RimM [Deltaproteobacteria bacterium]MDA8304674.1 ribosome maturation factor RimM [Deltaproteobacteria bacterium]
MKGYISVGEFVKPHGINGELLFIPYNPGTEAFSSDVPLFIQKNNAYERLEVEKIRPVNKGFLIKLFDFHSIDDALSLKKKQIFIKKNDITLDKNEYLISDLINLNCYNRKNKNIGTVTEVYQGDTDIIEIKSTEGTYLIPMTDENIISVDYNNNKVVVKNEENYKI